jgi:hypothetical protein
MFDEVRGHGLKCPAGHELGAMQTKDLERLLYVYEIVDNRLVHIDEPLPRSINIYTDCTQCEPERVVTTPMGDQVPIYPWCEYRLELGTDGTILATERVVQV